MLHQIVISDDDVRYSENILLPSSATFDSERVAFLKNLSSIDLQACPGSGKTTCLLAKLLIIGRQMPFDDGGGILVLSHTNVTVDKIKSTISKHCPHLFEYPNYIGTIQSFVDHFLAIPYYQQKYGHLPYRIDNDIYHEKLWIPKDAWGWLSNRQDKDKILHNLRFETDGRLTSSSKLPGNTTQTYKALAKMKEKLLMNGYLCYEDAFCLAECYLQKYPNIIGIMQERFCAVFIDEMQDTDSRQISVLNKLFPEGNQTMIQRIGDQNQAVYSHDVKSENVWMPKEDYLELNGSMRLSKSIADTIKNISLEPQELVGVDKERNIKPKLLIYNDKTIKQVPDKYKELIIVYDLHKVRNPVFKAIGWRRTDPGENKIHLASYFSDECISSKKSAIDHADLGSYFLIDEKKMAQEGLYEPRKHILNAICKVLRLANIRKDNGAAYSMRSLLTFLKSENEDQYNLLNGKLYNWSMALYNKEDICNEVADYIEKLLRDVFSITSLNTKVIDFMKARESQRPEVESGKAQSANVLNYTADGKEIQILIDTIHGVKGETHTATLYLETYYYNDAGKSYESQRLIEQIKGNRIKGKIGKRIMESLKMAYVGMSRPTDLLCFAVHQDHLTEDDFSELEANWDIIPLCDD